ncbi:UPF0489 family protein [Pedobacter sp. GR22-10]|uniref:UPF0489 family protein n=1 Tax=Pedobacter sp. GR22-10 TaxID=2994472 RepID=UPI00224829FB|nr:UPF0489 family protein [Pedobacter sp. GR22-10]MCX2431632.1 UPF0489 family protein [Pedobacter sp. GR22-10]
MSKHIPIFIVEEHSEVFPVWCACVERGLLKYNSLLMHFDEHSDMGIPRLNKSLNELCISSSKDLHEFTSSELGIATFIYPALYLGFFNRVYWFKQGVKVMTENEMFVTSHNGDGMRLIGGRSVPHLKQEKFLDPNFRFFQYMEAGEKSVVRSNNVAIDIDLDFFSCAGNPNELKEIRIETSENQYFEILNDPYHRIRYQNMKLHLEVENGKHYIVFNRYKYSYPNSYPSTLRKDENVIKQRIVSFIAQLIQKKISPQIITICRSRFSGFTPSDQWEFIEAELIGELAKLYNLNYGYENFIR